MEKSAHSRQQEIVNQIKTHPFVRLWFVFLSSAYFNNAIFSVKTFIAGMLALYIAFRLDLSQPSWSIATVYIISQPLSGMMLSKSWSRLLGTVIGAIMSVIAIALFAGTPEWFIFTIALWLGICLYVSVYLRDVPASYGAMLSGYTAAIVGFQAALHPATAFDIAVARCLEITLGIVCATVINAIFFPKTTGELFRTSVDNCVTDAGNWISDTLQGKRNSNEGLSDLRDLIADTIALENLRIHAAYDSPDVRASNNIIRSLQARLITMSSMLVSIHDRIALLRQERPSAGEKLKPLLDKIASTIDATNKNSLLPDNFVSPADAIAIDNEICALYPDFNEMSRNPDIIVERSILMRLRDIFSTWRDTIRLRSAVILGIPIKNLEPPPETDHYRDHTLAIVASLVAMTTLILTAAFWIATGWSYGSSAAGFAGIITCIAASHDNPIRIAEVFLNATIYAAVIAGFYILAILPSLNDFVMLSLAFGIVLIPVGILIPNPRFSWARTLCIHFIVLCNLHNGAHTHFVDFLNSTLALLIGILVGMTMFRILRPIGGHWAVSRLKFGMMRDLASLANAGKAESRSLFESRMIDRVNSIRVRLNSNNYEDRRKLDGSLATLRVGINILALQRTKKSMPERLRKKTEEALEMLTKHFQKCARSPETASKPNPIKCLNEAEQAILQAGEDSHEESVNSLLAVRNIQSILTQHPRFFGLENY